MVQRPRSPTFDESTITGHIRLTSPVISMTKITKPFQRSFLPRTPCFDHCHRYSLVTTFQDNAHGHSVVTNGPVQGGKECLDFNRAVSLINDTSRFAWLLITISFLRLWVFIVDFWPVFILSPALKRMGLCTPYKLFWKRTVIQINDAVPY